MDSKFWGRAAQIFENNEFEYNKYHILALMPGVAHEIKKI